ncbi:MAG TPA: 4-alpha-glucanotransferase [Rhizomicrobium sp.]|nr:4-alpha-glucanotransferase [Rhizomicrobium sp.]
MTEDVAVIALAGRAGLEVEWTDANGARRTVGPDTLKAVLKALDFPAENPADISESAARLSHDLHAIPPLQVVRPGQAVRIASSRHADLLQPDGTRTALQPRPADGEESLLHAPREPGYYNIECDNGAFALAVVPRHCVRPQDVGKGHKLAGIAVQIYSLRGGTSGSFGDFAALASFAKNAGHAGLDAIMVSPTHALFGADPGSFSPYSPSTRLFFNPLFADVTLEGLPGKEDTGSDGLIDWRRAGPAKYQRLGEAFGRFREKTDHTEFTTFCREGGDRLRGHALFEALDARFRKDGVIGFANWPAEFRGPRASNAIGHACTPPEEIEFQLFLQWLSARSVAAAQKAARESMAIGLIADIAVGVDPHGSHVWSAPDELLRGLHIGAPPDIFQTRGQDWGLTSFSPSALRRTGYASFLAMLSANMAHAGGVRIDHALGMRRLWVIPSGGSPADGVYLRYPQRELLGLTALESQRHQAIVIGEDLGTVPEGFRDELAEKGVPGMQVLWFERDRAANFISPGQWRRDAAAMTTTHDLPTVAGWWSGHDIDWQARLGRLRSLEDQERNERAADRERLWSALRRARCATGAAPPAGEPELIINAALQFIGKARCSLAIAPTEDIAGERDQPNLPGTTDEHPNWRRRMKQGGLLCDQATRNRIEAFVSARRAT